MLASCTPCVCPNACPACQIDAPDISVCGLVGEHLLARVCVTAGCTQACTPFTHWAAAAVARSLAGSISVAIMMLTSTRKAARCWSRCVWGGCCALGWRACVHTHMCTRMCTRMHAFTHTYTHPRTYVRACTQTRTPFRTRMHLFCTNTVSELIGPSKASMQNMCTCSC